MNISVELTFSPLQNDFEQHIINFIKKLRASGLTILENPLSTQVYGEYDEVMKVLNNEIKIAFELMDKGLLYMKLVKSDRSEYEPIFDFFFGQYGDYDTLDIALEIVAVLFGLLSVWFSKQNNIWVYPTGMLSTSIFVYLLVKWGLIAICLSIFTILQ